MFVTTIARPSGVVTTGSPCWTAPVSPCAVSVRDAPSNSRGAALPYPAEPETSVKSVPAATKGDEPSSSWANAGLYDRIVAATGTYGTAVTSDQTEEWAAITVSFQIANYCRCFTRCGIMCMPSS